MSDLFNKSLGVTIIESPYVNEFEMKTVKRTLKERLLTYPWEPLKKTKLVRGDRIVIKTQFGFICHPETAKAARYELEANKEFKA